MITVHEWTNLKDAETPCHSCEYPMSRWEIEASTNTKHGSSINLCDKCMTELVKTFPRSR